METRMTTEEVHSELRRLLGEFSRFCDKHGLRYYLAYGSLLGAVRGGDLIPWDDDVDVLMPRPDYEQFLELYEKNAQPSFFLLTPGSPDYPSSFTKLVSSRTRFESTQHLFPKEYGVNLDIFPLDGVPAKLGKTRFWVVKELMAVRHKVYPKDKPYKIKKEPSALETAKRFAWQLLNQPKHLPAWLAEQQKRLRRNTAAALVSRVPRSTMAGWADAAASRTDYEEAGMVADYFGWGKLDDALIERVHVDGCSHVKIGNLRVRTFAEPENLLEQWYGSDWRTPRPDFKPPHGEAFWRDRPPAASDLA